MLSVQVLQGLDGAFGLVERDEIAEHGAMGDGSVGVEEAVGDWRRSVLRRLREAVQPAQGRDVGDLRVVEVKPLQVREACYRRDVCDLRVAEDKYLQVREACHRRDVGDLSVV